MTTKNDDVNAETGVQWPSCVGAVCSRKPNWPSLPFLSNGDDNEQVHQIRMMIRIKIKMRIILITMTLSSLDDEFGEDLGLSLDDVPGLLNFTLRHTTRNILSNILSILPNSTQILPVNDLVKKCSINSWILISQITFFPPGHSCSDQSTRGQHSLS